VLELSDWCVFTVASFYHSEKDLKLRSWIRRNKRQLDKLHLAKIDISQAIVVVDVGDTLASRQSKRLRTPRSEASQFTIFPTIPGCDLSTQDWGRR
jgi:hypothetical protein